ncbi:MAG: hypothetical protein V2A74_11225, partial [bacterium]
MKARARRIVSQTWLAAAVCLVLGGITVCWGQAPDNDNFAGAVVISGQSGRVGGSNIGATKETGEPNHAGNPGGQSVWWTWTAPTSGTVQFTTKRSSFDTLLAIYRGDSFGNLIQIAANDDTSQGGVWSEVFFEAAGATTYRVAVDGYNRGSGAQQGGVALKWMMITSLRSTDFGASTEGFVAPGYTGIEGGSWQGAGTSYLNGRLGLFSPNNSTNYFGSWQSPPGYLPYQSDKVYRVRWELATDQLAPVSIPSARFRVSSTRDNINYGCLQFNASAGTNPLNTNSNVPPVLPNTRVYEQYFQPVDLSALQGNTTTAGLIMAFDLI